MIEKTFAKRKSEIIAGSLIIVLFFAITGSSAYSDNHDESREFNLSSFLENTTTFSQIQQKHVLQEMLPSNCQVTQPQDKTIILRLDDLGFQRKNFLAKILVNEVLKRDLKASLGLIPEELGKDKELINWLREIKGNTNIEIAQHGSEHTENEFQYMEEAQAKERITEGRDIIYTYLDYIPLTFIPPYNTYSSQTRDVLKEVGFKIISGGREDLDFNENFVEIGYTSSTYNFEERKFVSAEETVNDCKASLEETGLCVVMIHPQDYKSLLINRLNREKFEEFLKMLDGLENTGAEFKTFQDLVSCS